MVLKDAASNVYTIAQKFSFSVFLDFSISFSQHSKYYVLFDASCKLGWIVFVWGKGKFQTQKLISL
jgi:hypothetical protein